MIVDDRSDGDGVDLSLSNSAAVSVLSHGEDKWDRLFRGVPCQGTLYRGRVPSLHCGSV